MEIAIVAPDLSERIRRRGLGHCVHDRLQRLLVPVFACLAGLEPALELQARISAGGDWSASTTPWTRPACANPSAGTFSPARFARWTTWPKCGGGWTKAIDALPGGEPVIELEDLATVQARNKRTFQKAIDGAAPVARAWLHRREREASVWGEGTLAGVKVVDRAGLWPADMERTIHLCELGIEAQDMRVDKRQQEQEQKREERPASCAPSTSPASL